MLKATIQERSVRCHQEFKLAAANSAVDLLAYIVILIARNTATLGFELNYKWIWTLSV